MNIDAIRHLRIMIADDDKEDVELFQDAVTRIGASVDILVCTDGNELMLALQSLKPDPPDLLVLDLNMPKLDGKECLRRIRAMSCFDEMPVIIVSTSSSIAEMREVERLGGDRYIVKPGTFRELQHTVRSILTSALKGYVE